MTETQRQIAADLETELATGALSAARLRQGIADIVRSNGNVEHFFKILIQVPEPEINGAIRVLGPAFINRSNIHPTVVLHLGIVDVDLLTEAGRRYGHPPRYSDYITHAG